MVSIRLWNQIYKSQMTLSYLTWVEVHLLIGIIWLMGSFMVWPKVILLSSIYCISYKRKKKTENWTVCSLCLKIITFAVFDHALYCVLQWLFKHCNMKYFVWLFPLLFVTYKLSYINTCMKR